MDGLDHALGGTALVLGIDSRLAHGRGRRLGHRGPGDGPAAAAPGGVSDRGRWPSCPPTTRSDRIGATVRALLGAARTSPRSSWSTTARATRPSSVALAAGATVLRIPRRIGKGGALEGALRRLPAPDVWLLADADLGATAACLAPVLDTVLEDRADLAIAVLPPQAAGGLGTVRRFAARAILLLTAFEAEQPLSGQRAIRGAALEACRPLAAGFGVETAMTIDALRAGLRVRRGAGAGPRAPRHRPGRGRLRAPRPAGPGHPACGGGARRCRRRRS